VTGSGNRIDSKVRAGLQDAKKLKEYGEMGIKPAYQSHGIESSVGIDCPILSPMGTDGLPRLEGHRAS
jgi:hypothetical protein